MSVVIRLYPRSLRCNIPKALHIMFSPFVIQNDEQVRVITIAVRVSKVLPTTGLRVLVIYIMHSFHRVLILYL